jgi:polysaccharide pyruvyl transferase WcaK-like protein/O-antigen/teichoic acid export membrane protein
VVARSLGVEGKGTVSAILLCSAVLGSIGVLGTREGLSYFVAKAGPSTVPGLIRSCVKQALVISVICAIICLWAQQAGMHALRGQSAILIGIAGAATAVIVLGSQLQAILIALSDVVVASCGPILQIGIALILYLTFITTGYAAVSGAVVAYLVGLVVGLLFYAARLRYLIQSRSGSSGSTDGYWWYCGKAAPSSVAQFLNGRFDQTVIAATVGASGLGIYGAAVNISEIVAYPAASISAIALPATARSDNKRALALMTLGVSIAVGLSATVALWYFGPHILVSVFGPGFGAGIPVLRVLLVAGLAAGVGRVSSTLCAGFGHPEIGTLSALAALVFTTVGCLLFIPRYGLLGAAWVSLVAYSVTCIVALLGLAVRMRTLSGSKSDNHVLVTHLYSDMNAGDAGITEGLCDELKEAGYKSVQGWSTLSGRPEEIAARLPYNASRFQVLYPALWAGFGDDSDGGGWQRQWRAAVVFLLQGVRAVACLLMPWLVLAPIWSHKERRTIDAAARADVIISKGGGFFYCEGLRDIPFLLRMCLPLIVAGAHGKRVELFGQTIGPLRGRLSQWVMRRTLKISGARVWARESRTVALLREIGIKEKQLDRVPDCAFKLRKFRTVGLTSAAPIALRRAALSIRPWNFPGSLDSAQAHAHYMASIVGAVRHLSEAGWEVSLVAQVISNNPAEDDRRACDEVSGILGLEVPLRIIVGPKSPGEWISFYASQDLVISTRMHSAIFSMCAGTPPLTISYNPKGLGIMEDSGLAEWCVDINTIRPEYLIHLVDRLIGSLDVAGAQVRQQVDSNVKALRGGLSQIGSVVPRIEEHPAWGSPNPRVAAGA